jgi:MraZ protein
LTRYFRSQFTNRIDAKGRVSVPASFRSVIAEGGWQGVCCLRAPSARAINAYTQARLDELTDMIERHDPMSEQYEDLNLALNGGTWEIGFDSEGRIILPEELLHHARISGEATFVGLGRYFQIWEPASFAGRFERAFEAVKADPGLLNRRPERAGDAK